MNLYEKKLTDCYNNVKNKCDFTPDIAIVLGSGLGEFASSIKIEYVIKYSEIEGFPISTVSGHDGNLIFGFADGYKVVLMQGRIHYYEGYAMEDVILPIRLMKMLGARFLILTNASGAVNTDFSVGNLMAIKGHISAFVPSPLIGKNLDFLGERFPDMSSVYDKELIKIIKYCGDLSDIDIKEGVYLQTTGPNYETPEEVKMYKLLGADVVGMSTAVEAIAGVHCGMKVCGISCITNMASGIENKVLSHKDVKEVSSKVSVQLEKILKDLITNIGVKFNLVREKAGINEK